MQTKYSSEKKLNFIPHEKRESATQGKGSPEIRIIIELVKLENKLFWSQFLFWFYELKGFPFTMKNAYIYIFLLS